VKEHLATSFQVSHVEEMLVEAKAIHERAEY
jgi:hypothetical protein